MKLLIIIIIFTVFLFYTFRKSIRESITKNINEAYQNYSPAPVINSNENIKKKENSENIINDAFQYLDKYSVLDKSITSVFPDYSRPSSASAPTPTNRTNFDQIDLYLQNAPII
jgi:hypothetical protein